MIVDPRPARCPSCGFGAGVYIDERDRRAASSPVRCFSCEKEASSGEWFAAGAVERRQSTQDRRRTVRSDRRQK
ncbi:MAG TPA: hypothetical protein VFO21_05155 [Vicinamibacterales bacterium]|nr:hypothetical protein [Vicinamibacterales bacterium]